MNDNKKVIIIVLFIFGFLIITGLMGLLSKIPFIGRAFGLILAVILIIFVICVFIFAGRRK